MARFRAVAASAVPTRPCSHSRPPPCTLVSGDGFVHVVETDKECLQVSEKHGLRNTYTRQMIARKPGHTEHKGWQLFEDAQ